MKKNFDNNKYFNIQRSRILNDLKSDMRYYMEIGGKLIDDQHATRVLYGFDPNIKIKVIDSLNIDYEVVICLSSTSILKKKKRKDNKKTYIDEVYYLVEYFQNKNKKVNVAITKYYENIKVDKVIHDFTKKGINIFKFYLDDNYPLNVDEVVSDSGLGRNDFIPCNSNLVLVIAPGPNSGKCAVAISQIYNERRKGVNVSYRKYETFLIPSLSINNPINLACSMAMCDVRGDDCIDVGYLKKFGEIHVIDERDKQAFEILKKILPQSELSIKTSMSEFFLNSTLDGIVNIDICQKHAKREIIRRYKEYLNLFRLNKMSQIEFDEACRIYQLIQHDIAYSDEETKELLKEFIEFWGYECQSTVAMEEMGELIQALCKYKREDYEEKYIDNILEEIADVHNMIDQLELYFGYDTIRKIRCQKLDKAKKYLKIEKEEQNEK